MKTIREVTEITGLTRKALRGYDEIGLIHPTEKASSGKWLYDDAAIVQLIAIESFVEAGYTRKEIKQILAKPKEEAKAIQEELISKLEEKKRRLEGMINMIRLNAFLLSLPEKVLNTFLSLGITAFLEGKTEKNYKDTYSEIVDVCADSEDYDLFNAEMGILIYAYTILLGRVKTDDPAHKGVQWYVRSLFDRYYAEVKKISEQYGKDTDEAGTYKYLANLLDDILHDPEEREMYDLYCKPGYEVFIMKAVDVYMQSKGNNKT